MKIWVTIDIAFIKKTNTVLVSFVEKTKLDGQRWPSAEVIFQKKFWTPLWGHGLFWTLSGLNKQIAKFEKVCLEKYAKKITEWQIMESVLEARKSGFGEKRVSKKMGIISII